MRPDMRKDIVRYLIYAATVLVGVLFLSEFLDLGISPLGAFAAAVAVPCLLIALWRFPAIFIVPVMFVPRDKRPLPAIPMRFQGQHMTILPLVLAALCAAILLRFALLAARGTRLRELFPIQKRGIKAYLLFAAVVTISYVYTRAPEYGGDKILRFLTIGALCFFASFILLREDKDFCHFTVGLVVMALVAGATRVQATSVGHFGVHEPVVHIGIGQCIGMTIVMVLNFRLFKSRWAKSLLLLSLPLLFAGLIASEVRGAMIWTLLVVGVFAFIRQPNVRPKYFHRVFALGAAAVVMMLFLMPPKWVRGEAAVELEIKQQELVMLMHGKGSKFSGGKRLEFYKGAFQAISAKPVAGWGVGGWATYYFHQDDAEVPHFPHNLFLETGVEEGLLGLAALLALLATTFGAARTVFREGGERFAFLLPVLIYSLGVTMTSGDIDDNVFLWFWCGAALATYGLVKSRAQEATARQALGS